MSDTKTMIGRAYMAFNRRDIDGALALMTQDVSWPKASEGGKVVGKEEIRAYWTRQWAEFDPHVEPLTMTEEDAGKMRVRVHQLVKSPQGRHSFGQRGSARIHDDQRSYRRNDPRR